MLNYVSQCSKLDIKTNNNKAYHYILECTAYLPVPGAIFPAFLKLFSFPFSTRAFHSLDGIIGGYSYIGFFSRRRTLYWSLKIFRCCPSFYRTFDVSKVSFPNRLTKKLVISSFNILASCSTLCGWWARISPSPNHWYVYKIYHFLQNINAIISQH